MSAPGAHVVGLPAAPEREQSLPAADSILRAMEQAVPAGYEILGVLGRGGMGIVYRARHTALNRNVALKMIREGELATPEEFERFYREAEAVARLRHPNIVQIYEVGRTGSNPYFSLEYVEGGTLHAFLDRRPQDPKFAAQMLEQIARAAHHAHEEGIVHRDLKPVNILLSEMGRRRAEHESPTTSSRGNSGPATESVVIRSPKITDFGLARRLDESARLTQSGCAAGTPAYMAPEQFVARGPVGPAADIYSLGVILYEILTGRTPFAGSSVEIMHQTLNQDPVPPRRLQPTVPRDLETICLKCLNKEPRHRYETAEQLADDLNRFLAGRPIVARAVGPLGQALLWRRRNPVTALLLSAVVLALLLGAGVASFFAIRAENNAYQSEQNAMRYREQRRVAEKETARALQAETDKDNALRGETREREFAQKLAELKSAEAYDAHMVIAHRDWEKGQVGRAQQILRLYEPAPGKTDRRGFEWHYLDRLTRAELFECPETGSGPIAASPDGERFATVNGGKIDVWSAATGKIERRLSGHASYISAIDFDRTGKLLLSAGHDKTVRIHRIADGEQIRVFKEHSRKIFNARFTPDGESVVSSTIIEGNGETRGELFVWRVDSGQVTHRLGGFSGTIMNLAFTPDGKTLFGCGASIFLNRWDLASGKAYPLIRCGNTPLWRIALSPRDGRRMAAALINGAIVVMDPLTGTEMRTFRGTSEIVSALAFSPDGDYLAASGADSLIHHYHLGSGHETHTFRGNGTRLLDLAFSPGQTLRIAATSTSGTIKVWDARFNAEMREIGISVTAARIAISPDGRLAAVGGNSNKLLLFEMPGWRPAGERGRDSKQSGLMRDVRFSPNGDKIAVVTDEGTIEFYPAKSGAPVPRNIASTNGSIIASGAFASDGRRFATGHHDGSIAIRDLDAVEAPLILKGHQGTVQSLAFDPGDGDRLVSGGDDGSVRFWNLKERRAIRVQQRAHHVHRVSFSPDGKKLLSSGAANSAIIWDVATMEPLHMLEGHADSVLYSVFSPKGDRAVTTSVDGSVKLFDVATGKETLTLRESPATRVTWLAFIDDGKTLVGAARDQRLRLWETATKVVAPER